MASLIKAGRNNVDGSVLVGYFRSHIREGLCLGQEDQQLINEHFQDESSVFLVVRPFEIGVCIAGFFFWEDNKLQTDASDLEVPFGIGPEIHDTEQPGELNFQIGSSPEFPAVTTAAEAFPSGDRVNNLIPPETSPGSNDRPTQNQPTGGPQPRRLLLLSRLVLAGGLGIVAGYLAYRGLPGARSALQALANYAAQNPLELRVSGGENGQLTLQWNGESPQLANAYSAKVSISDGSSSRELYMKNAQLKAGKLIYFPSRADVQFRLEVYLDDRHSVSESIRVLLPKAESLVLDAAVAAAPEQTSYVPIRLQDKLDPKVSQPQMSHRLFRYQKPLTGDPRASVSTGAPEQSLPAPDVPVSADQPDPAAITLASLFSPTLPVSPALSNSVENSRKSPTRDVRPVSVEEPDSGKPHSLPYVQPRPLRQATPDTRHLPPNLILQPSIVAIRVRIDATGRVVGAHPAENQKGSLFLVGAAIAAARKWTFEPAAMRGIPVAADQTIFFEFRPAN